MSHRAQPLLVISMSDSLIPIDAKPLGMFADQIIQVSFFSFFPPRWNLVHQPGMQSNGTIPAHCNLHLLGSNDSHASASQAPGTTGM